MKGSLRKKVVVSGGAGFIGSHLVDALIKKGFEVHVIDNLVNGKREHVNKKAILHEADIRDLKKVEEIIKGAKYVFHAAAMPRVQFSIDFPVITNDVNVNGTLNILLAAKKAKVEKVIYSASSSAYGEQKSFPLKEDMIPRPKSPYGLQKYMGEQYCRVFSDIHNLKTVSLRYFSVYGPRQNNEGAYTLVITKFLSQKKEGKPLTITGDGKQTRDFTHVNDVVRANLLAAVSNKVGKGEVINIGGGRNYSVNQVAKMIGGPVVHIPPRIEPKDTLADITKAKKLLGWEPKEDFKKGVESLKKQWKL